MKEIQLEGRAAWVIEESDLAKVVAGLARLEKTDPRYPDVQRFTANARQMLAQKDDCDLLVLLTCGTNSFQLGLLDKGDQWKIEEP